MITSSIVNRFPIIVLLMFIFSCNNKEDITDQPQGEEEKNLTIFFFNDPHGQLNNFAKIKHIMEKEKETSEAILLCGGDIFSGNPIVDQYAEKGYPIIDIMNQVGVDVAVIGNHEFDYGLSVLKSRVEQKGFSWVCANVDTKESGLSQFDPYVTLSVAEMDITILGLVETNGKPGAVIPSTHPWRVRDIEFQRYSDVVGQYKDLKESENSDLFIALTHLGENTDRALASEFPYFDLIIGGHSHSFENEPTNGIPIFQAGSYLSHLGKLELTIKNKKITGMKSSFIDLNEYTNEDQELRNAIDTYNDEPKFDEVVGYASSYLNTTELGCFYTTALKEYWGVDASLQNGGGIRAGIDEGDITTLEIYRMDPFNNGNVIYTMSVGEIKQFFLDTNARMHMSGIRLERSGDDIIVYDENEKVLGNNEQITLSINDYIPAVYDNYFPYEDAEIKNLTTADVIINYLKTTNSTVDYEGCNRFY